MGDSAYGQTEHIVIRRIIDAPVDLVWEAWTKAEHVAQWWGPKYYISPLCKVDFRVGGTYVFSMQAPADQGAAVTYSAGKYERIVPKKRLEFTQYVSDSEGSPIDPTDIGMPSDFPKRMHITITFEPRHDLTRLIVTIRGWTSGQMFVYALAGWHQQIDKLEDSLN
jgi:uncharacterized protein YndB with AHSA1/START domain